ncbi:pyrroline-5-carboxylate reductase [Wenzhouxiangella sp. XN79A]|uniref:pyrroline-5-carboxylate reductase n=1 Tax=Wenzhouxiangella sp. XN79A TaxID=2724193 RepID=UPI00144A7543|nr:pyrroline-5-carboxylate reductase [Wenzhouxiangella sp. XN79A]NKI35031.1 pyrroline-5-carboxylate reductase [Wenzhouxiangella sp. XN79A]
MTARASSGPHPVIAFIGAGNMARALIGGLLDGGHPAERLRAADPGHEARDRVRSLGPLEVAEDNADVVAGADVVVLAVKPQVIDPVLRELAGLLADHALVVSVAAGIPTARLQRELGAPRPVVRAMPNTPALLGRGATGLYAVPACSDAQRATGRSIFEAVGVVVEVEDEALMDVVTAVSGSGPAYFFALAEALAEAGEAAGLPRRAARTLADHTAAGAGAMMATGTDDAATLRERVTSPGGTTAAALDRFAADGLDRLVFNAVDAAIRRGRELGKDS